MSDPIDRLTSALADRYRIERELGQGGMASVHLAHDLKHERDVAIKVLHPDLGAALGGERFLTEIRTTARLQHPHILPLLDSGEAGGLLYYVMPLVTGETLRARLEREKQLPIDDALRIAREVADALDYAHGLGVIHRDVKPENILLQGGHALVADFGIALAVQQASGQRLTQTGLSLGTPQYMSPEQAMGERTIDARSDIYALGAVTYEMLTGDPPFTGSTVQAIVAKVLTEKPAPLIARRERVTLAVEHAVLTALEKLPADRFESAAKFADALGNPAFTHRTAATASPDTFRAPRTWNRVTVAMTALAAALVVLLGAAALSSRRDSRDERPVVRFALSDDPSVRIDAGMTWPFTVSVDGRTIVFRASTDSAGPRLWVRTIGDPRARAIEGTDDGGNAAISPDGNWVAFVVRNRSLRKVRITGGGVSRIAELDGVAAALSWASNDEIVFEQIAPDAGIHRANANGGRPELVVPLDTTAGEVRQRRPIVLRDAGIVVYASYTHNWDEPTLTLYRLSDKRRERLGLPGVGALALIDDRLVYSRVDGTLMAVTLDVDAMRVVGRPVQVSPRVAAVRTGTSVGLSEGGTLVYRSAGTGALARLDLVDTAGSVRTIRGEFAVQGTPRFSPDGRRVVIGIGAEGVASRALEFFTSDLWIIDLATAEPTRVTTGNTAAAAAWSPDGRRLIYLVAVDSGFDLWSAHVDGSVPPSRLVAPTGVYAAVAVVPDGRSVIVQTTVSRKIARGTGLLRIWIDGSARVDTVVAPNRGGLRPEHPRVSADGRWVAFLDRTTSDVWVRSLSGAGLLQVSTTGTDGNVAAWTPDSRHLLFASTEGVVMIELRTDPTLSVVRRRAIRGLPPNEGYDLAPDGKTFVVVRPVRLSTDIFAAVNWADEARREWRVAAQK